MRKHSLNIAAPATHPSTDIELSADAVAFIRLGQAYVRHCAKEDVNALEHEHADWLREGDALSARTSAAAERVLCQPPRTIGDILARACILAHYHGYDLTALGDDDPGTDMRRWSSENLALAILKCGAWPTDRVLRSALQSGGRHD
jgi:hypothetical protein